MNRINKYSKDIEAILSRRYGNGADYWATSDMKLNVGSPFTTLESAYYLRELGMSNSNPILKKTADLILSVQKEDGRFKLSPKGAIYPCHTITAVKALCYLGHANDMKLEKSFKHLLDIQYKDGGWRCNKFSFGKGPETDFSNPGPTLSALDAFRFTKYANNSSKLDHAVEFLLNHWTIRKPIGPCHYGIGKLFMQISYPFNQYNIFYYVYVLSFYKRAREDKRFIEAFEILKSKLIDNKIVVERPNYKLSNFEFCKKGEQSELATMRYNEILNNINKERVAQV